MALTLNTIGLVGIYSQGAAWGDGDQWMENCQEEISRVEDRTLAEGRPE